MSIEEDSAEGFLENKGRDKDKILKEVLPFSVERQRAALGHLIADNNFFLQCYERIKASWFNDPYCQKIWSAKTEFYKKWKRPPSEVELLDSDLINREVQRIRELCRAKVLECRQQAENYSKEAIQGELTEWLHARFFYEGVNKGAEYWNRGQLEEAYVSLEGTVRSIRETSFHQDVPIEFDVEALATQIQADISGAFTFGISSIDRILLKEGNGSGSMLPGSSTLLLAPSDIGKTTTLITVACANLKLGRSVLFLFHEGIKEQIQMKFLCCLLNRNREWILSTMANKDAVEDRNRIYTMQRRINTLLTLIPMCRAGLTVEAVVPVIRRRQEERILQFGKGYDILVDDYAAKLTTEEARGGRLEKRSRDEIVYSNFGRLAEEYRFHNLGAIQTNREGSKVNRGFKGYEDRLLEMEDVMESWPVMADAQTVITINRPPIAMAQDWVTFKVVKSKTGSTGWAVCCRSNYGCCVSHSEELGSTWYRGTSTGSDRMHELINTYVGRTIPDDVTATI